MDQACPATSCRMPKHHQWPMGVDFILWWNHPRKCLGKGREKGVDHLCHLSPVWGPFVPWRCMANHQCGKIQFCEHTGWWHCPNDGPCTAKHLLLPHPRPQGGLQAESHQWRHHLVLQLIHGFGRRCCPKANLVQQRRFRDQVLHAVCQCPWPSCQACRWWAIWISLCYHSIQPAQACHWPGVAGQLPKVAYQVQLLHQAGLCTVAASHWLGIFEACPNVEPAIAGKGHNQTSHAVLPWLDAWSAPGHCPMCSLPPLYQLGHRMLWLLWLLWKVFPVLGIPQRLESKPLSPIVWKEENGKIQECQKIQLHSSRVFGHIPHSEALHVHHHSTSRFGCGSSRCFFGNVRSHRPMPWWCAMESHHMAFLVECCGKSKCSISGCLARRNHDQEMALAFASARCIAQIFQSPKLFHSRTETQKHFSFGNQIAENHQLWKAPPAASACQWNLHFTATRFISHSLPHVEA